MSSGNGQRRPEHRRTILESNIGDEITRSLSNFELLRMKTNLFSKGSSKIEGHRHPGYLQPWELPIRPFQMYLELKDTYYNANTFANYWQKTSSESDKTTKQTQLVVSTNFNIICARFTPLHQRSWTKALIKERTVI